MGRLLSRSVTMVLVMLALAYGLSARKPVAPSALAGQAAGESNPWALNTTTGPAAPKPAREPRVIGRDSNGQFYIDGFVNDHQIRFLIDTGADLVALPEAEAMALGVEVREEDFRPMLRTASGTAEGAHVVLRRLDVAGATLTNVNAVVVRGLDINLLGQSALRQLGKVSLQGDAMVIGG